LAAVPSHWTEPFARLAVELELTETDVDIALVRVRDFVARIVSSVSSIPRKRLRSTDGQWSPGNETIEEPDRNRTAAIARLKAGIASMRFFSEAGLPTREKLHDRR
jgi:hypothetical protein